MSEKKRLTEKEAIIFWQLMAEYMQSKETYRLAKLNLHKFEQKHEGKVTQVFRPEDIAHSIRSDIKPLLFEE